MATDVQPSDLLDRVQELSEELEQLPDVRARSLAQELVATVIAMYGDGLERIMAVIESSGQARETLLDQLAQDGAVASLLLIHDLYPVSLRDRVLEALDTVRPYMESHGGDVELVGLEDGVARLVLQGSCNGCAASRATLELAIKQALDEHAPDLAGLEVQGVTPESNGLPGAGPSLPMADGALDDGGGAAVVATGDTGVELPMVHSGPASEPSASEPQRPARWVPVADSARPAAATVRTVSVDGVGLVLGRGRRDPARLRR